MNAAVLPHPTWAPPAWAAAPEPLRIVQVAACPWPTTQGTQVYLRGLVRALVRRGHDVHLVTYHFGEDLPDEGATVHRIAEVPGYRQLRAGPAPAKPLLDAMLAARLLQVTRRVRPHLLHAHNYEAPLAAYAVRALTGVPVLYTSHNLMGDELHSYFASALARRGARLLGRVLDASVPRGADAVQVLCPESLDAHLQLGVPAPRLSCVPPGVHLEDFGDRPAPLPSSCPPVVLYAGNPDGYQDLDLLLAAFARLLRRRPDAKLHVVSGADLAPLRAAASRQGLAPSSLRWQRTSSWEAVREAICGARVAALPRGLCRGFPIKLLNYMVLGRPTVACEGASRVLRPGVDGEVVHSGDVGGFALALQHLLDHPAAADRMGAAARASILREHLWQHRVEDLEDDYARTCRLAPSRGLG